MLSNLFLEGLSPEISITINPRLNVSAPTAAKVGVPIKFTVSAAPATPGAQVTLQRFDGKVWLNLSTTPLLATTTDLTATELIRGVASYRISVISSADSAQSTSAPFTLLIR